MRSKSLIWFVAGILLMLVLVQGVQAGQTYAYVRQFGSWGTGNGEFDAPEGVAVDPTGNVYVVDYTAWRIQSFDNNGNYVNKWDTGSYPTDVAVDSTGRILVCVHHKVQIFSPAGTLLSEFGSFGTGNGQFQSPSSIAVDSSDNIYVTDVNRVHVFQPDGTFVRQRWYSSPDGPSGIAVDTAGNVYIAVSGTPNRIEKYDSTLTLLTQWGSTGTGNGEFDFPTAVAVDNAGNVYVVDVNNDRIQKFTSNGVYLGQWGYGSYSTPGGGWVHGLFGAPRGIDVDTAGNVYVSDSTCSIYVFARTQIKPGATVFIGEEALDISQVMGTDTLLAWWAPAQNPSSDPPQGVFTPSVTNFYVAPSIFINPNPRTGTWYAYHGVPPTGGTINVAEPTLDMEVWDDANIPHNGDTIPRDTRLKFRITTNMNAATNVAQRSPVNSATNGYIDIKVLDKDGATYRDLLNDDTGVSGAGPNSILRNFVDGSTWYWGELGGYSWQTGALGPDTEPYYQSGMYTITAESTLGNMKTNYGAIEGKTVSVARTVTLVAPTITVITPQGVETWTQGTSQYVCWTYTGDPGPNVEIVLVKGGIEVDTILASTAISNHYYLWPISPTLATGSDYAITVRSTSQPTITDTSNGYFTIAAATPTITVTSPNGGETWEKGTTHQITWTYNNEAVGSTVDIRAECTGGGGGGDPLIMKDIATNVPVGSLGSGSYSWSIPPDFPEGNTKIDILYSMNPLIGDLSDNSFTIAAATPTLTVTSIYPNAAENTRVVSIMDLSGTGFDPSGATVKLTQAGQPDIPAANIGYASSEKLTCDFDLTGKATGHWDVVVTSPPGGETATLTNGFTVTSPAPARIAAFTYDATNMLTVQFNDTSTGGSHTRLWDFGDGSATDTTSPTTHAYLSPGTYPVTLNATYSVPDYSDTETKLVTVVGITRVVAKSDAKVGALAHPNEETKTSSMNPVSANYKVKLTREDESFTTTKPGYVVAKHALRRNGDGPTDYYFVDSDGGVTPLGTKNSLPLNVVIEAEDPYSETNGVTSEASQGGGTGVGLGSLPLLPKCGSSCANNYALLIDGGKSPEDNHIRYWNDIAFMYQTLNKVYGYPKANIKVLMSDGTANSPYDRHITTVGGVAQKDNSPRDLDSDGTDESTVSGIDSATKVKLTTYLNNLNTGKTASNHLFIFTTGHGAENPAYATGTGNVMLNLWYDNITDTEFVNALPVNFGSITIMMEQCYGGGFIDNFIPSGYNDANQKRIIHTAANPYEPSYGNGYSNVWTRGVAMITDNRVPSNEAEAGSYGNNDGYVAMSEICSFAWVADPANSSSLAHFEHPMCQISATAGASTRYLTSGNWISTPSVVVSSPNTNEIWSRGYARKITWNSKNIANVKIELYNSSSARYFTLKDTTAAAARYWNWDPIPTSTVTGTQIYKVRISNASNSNTNDVSDQYFTIQSASPGTLTINLLPTTGGPGNNGATGATITLDGDATITSGATVTAGTHSVTVKKTGWLDQTQGYTQLTAGSTRSFTLDLIGENERSGLPNSATDAGGMVITSTPMGAEVWIAEGSGAAVLKGTTPYEQAIIPGTNWKDNYPRKYTVTVKSMGYKPAVPQDVKVGKGQTASADFVLEPEYTFTGFDAPVDMNEIINTAKAGSNIPLKWKLLYNGNYVTGSDIDRKKFSLRIQTVLPEFCGAGSEDMIEVLDTSTLISSLSYQGNGQWHYNWKTAKGDFGKCMKIDLLYDNTLTSPYAKFKLR